MDFARINEGTRSVGGDLVIGGGNVAYDVARSAVRPQMSSNHEAAGDFTPAMHALDWRLRGP